MECERGSVGACATLGHYLTTIGRGGPLDMERGIQLLRQVCSGEATNAESFSSKADSCQYLAIHDYSIANSLQERLATAKTLFEFCPASENRLFYICTTLAKWADQAGGTLNGVTKDEWLKRACEAGSGFSCSELGKTAEVETTKTYFFERACDAMNSEGCTEYISRLENGIGIEMNKIKASELRSFMCSVNAALCQK
jgi:TPR repeat protein